MNPNDPHDFIELDRFDWTMTVDDLAEDTIRILQLTPDQTDTCEVCNHWHHVMYCVWVSLPCVEDGWHKWGKACLSCMAAIVAAGGTPIHAMSADR